MAYQQEQGNRPRSEDPGNRVDGQTHHDPENARDDADSRRIQHDIDDTRASMDSTLERLGERLSPSHLVDSVTEWFAGSDSPTGTHGPRDDTIRRASRNAAESAWQKVRDNPLAATGIAASIAWLFLKGDRHESNVSRERILRNSREPRLYAGSYVDARTGEPYDIDTYGRRIDRESDSTDGTGSRISDMASTAAHGVKDAAGFVADKVGDAASGIGGAAKSAASSTGDSIRSAGHHASDAASAQWHAGTDAAGDFYDSARANAGNALHRGQEQFHRAVESHPLAIGVAALAAGVLAGLAVPSTRREEQLVGEQSRRFTNAVEAEARREGIAPDQLREKAGDLMDDAREAASDAGDAIADRTDEAREALTTSSSTTSSTES